MCVNAMNLPGGGHPCRFTPSSEHSQSTSQTLNVLTETYNVKVHDSTIRKRLNKCGLVGRVAKRKSAWMQVW